MLALPRRRWAQLGVVQLRLLLGFAFIPAGLKKVLGQPFTAPENTGAFHEFLHAFHATGFFYRFVGAVQLAAALLLFSQRFAGSGALLLLPVLTAILVFCWSTGVYPTAIVVTLMYLATLGLLLWEHPRALRRLISTGRLEAGAPLYPTRLYDERLWQLCGLCIVSLYSAACVTSGEIYRPRGADWDSSAFYFLLLIPLCPVVTLAIERRLYAPRLRAPAPTAPGDPPGAAPAPSETSALPR